MGPLSIKLRGEECEISDISIGPAEPDVGLMSAYCDSYKVTYGPFDVTDDLTKEEDEEVTKKIMDCYYEEIQ